MIMTMPGKTLRNLSVLLTTACALPLAADTGDVLNAWSSAESGSAWVSGYGECWQSQGGATNLAPCAAPVEKALPVPEVVTVRLGFAFDSADIQSINNHNELMRLDGLITQLKDVSAYITVVGHTDAKGSEAYNQKLGLRRAAAVREYLISKGIPSDQVAPPQSMGERDLLIDYSPAAAEQRRVVIQTEV